MRRLEALPYFTGTNAPEIKPVDWLIPQFLARGVGTILFGQPGVSKTAHAATLMACLCSGKSFVDLEVRRPYRVLYLDLDAGWNWSGELFKGAFTGAGFRELPGSFAYWSPLTDTDAFSGEPLSISIVNLQNGSCQIRQTE